MRDLRDFPDADLRIFDRPPPPPPEAIRRVYLIGICGKGMGAMAELLVQSGYAVVGSDEAAYPPMSTRLEGLGIPIREGYREANLAEAEADLVVVGNAAVPTHPEAAYAREHGLPQLSLPEALAHFFLERHTSLVVAGTHGKTTTTGMLVHVLKTAGLDPGFLVGGIMTNYRATCGVGSGPHFVVEGDEYDSAYFDKRPKFMHYRPDSAIVTSMEFDHADIYDDWDDYREAFRRFVGLLPEDGLLVLNGDDPEVRALAEHTSARVRFFGLQGGDDHVTAHDVRAVEGGQRFELIRHDERLGEIFLPMSGWVNRFDALGVCAVALDEGVEPEALIEAFRTFEGMKRRQEIRGEVADVIVMDDFAHHPTAVHATVHAVQERWPSRRTIAVFEPRSNSSRRKVFEETYPDALAEADAVFISAPPLRHNDEAAQLLDPRRVAEKVTALGTPAAAYDSADALLPHLLDTLQPGDVALVMSNGSFDGLHDKLLAALKQREAARV
ncbi:MAG: Mur ligase family protein [Rhodothermales bacterium]|nr:Mur ligase family protein [Rhodothermales bacterium]